MKFLIKLITLLTIMDNNIYIFLHVTLVTSLPTADVIPNLSDSNYIYPYYKWYKLCSNSTNSYAVLGIIIQTYPKR